MGVVWRVYLVNLAQDTGRYARSAAQLESQGIPFERVAAVDGRALSDDEVAGVYDAAANRRRARYPLTRPEIGCYLSHIAVWRQIAESSDAGGFIFEDDFHIAADTKEVLAKLSHGAIQHATTGKVLHACAQNRGSFLTSENIAPANSPVAPVAAGSAEMNLNDATTQWDIIKLFTLKPQPRCISRQPLTADRQIVIPYRVPNCTVAYGISKPCAQQLIKIAQPFFRPIDEDHKFFWEHNLKIAAVLPPPVTPGNQQSTAGTIGDARRQFARTATATQKIRQAGRNLSYRLRYTALLHYHRRFGL